MPTVIYDNRLHDAVRACVPALQRIASYQLEPAFERRLQVLGERKEFLDPDEHSELLALVQFCQQRTLEKLEAEVALGRLRTAAPDLLGAA